MARPSASPVKRKRPSPSSQQLECTGCANGAFAEHLHPLLKVPICGACRLSQSGRDDHIDDKNEISCVWCGLSDGCELFMCDTCVHSFCTDCVLRNFGREEANAVRELDVWICYLCSNSERLSKLKLAEESISLNSLDKIYCRLRPPPKLSPVGNHALLGLSVAERTFACIFSPDILRPIVYHSDVLSYLCAKDLYSVVYVLSRGLKRLLASRPFFTPGLFKTEFGYENRCRLFEHQIVSLGAMHELENSSSTFGALRGGVFGDEPGLGKTVSMLALILSTAGQQPKRPDAFWDSSRLAEQWELLRGGHGALLLPIMNRLLTAHALGGEQPWALLKLRKQVVDPKRLFTLEGFEATVKSTIRCLVLTRHKRQSLKDLFSFEMNRLKGSLDSKSRKLLQNRGGHTRGSFERMLCPTAATLVVVPLALLEHWYEQIVRHVNLQYLADEDGGRGLVYLDGLGDIMDVKAPISRLQVREDCVIDSIEKVSNYLIVVTTLERCAQEGKGRSFDENFDWRDASAKGVSALLQLRWLRLVVDEGHELTLSSPSGPRRAGDAKAQVALYNASKFVALIAAERRWIMSGTPTTGALAGIGLMKLYVLLSFLRHPRYGVASGAGSEKKWRSSVVDPCVKQDPVAWQNVACVIKEVMVRHLKEDLKLPRPVHVVVNLNALSLAEDTDDPQADMLADDRAKAKHITDTLFHARRTWRQQYGAKTLRRPKAIVFSQFDNDLQGVGHFLYSMMGDENVCEHFGPYKSSELSRFRHSKKKFRTCPLCGHQNGITSDRCCDKTLYLVEYVEIAAEGRMGAVPEPQPSGHGAGGPGGHYVGRCLCSPIGCVGPCGGFPNPLFASAAAPGLINPNFALVCGEHLRAWFPGADVVVNQHVQVLAECERADGPFLWRGGRMGGSAIVRQWRPCGGHRIGGDSSWHGSNVLETVPWQVVEEDAMVLLLAKDGSTGLDLSFATHIFLLERIHDPALRNQIVSRAHRVGATGPVQVQLLQVISQSVEAR